MSHRRMRACLLAAPFLLLGSAVLAQSLSDVAAAGAAADNVGAGSAGPARNQANAIRRGFEGAANENPTGGPYGHGPSWVPGMPLPGPGAGEGGAEPEAASSSQGNKNGLIFYDQLRDSDAGLGGEGPVDAVPDQYIVVKGDTLWSICARFFQNPWYWPKLWSYNDSITNPHWIYPGDVISMYPPGQRPQRQAAPKPQEPKLPRLIRSGPLAPGGLFLPQTGFVETGELDLSGKIAGSKEEKIMLAAEDEVYLEMNKKNPLKVKERYTIYRVMRPVRRNGKGEKLGESVQILGEIEVRQITGGGIARGVIREALAPIERGDRVGPLRRIFKRVDPKKNRYSLEGAIVETIQPASMLSSEQLLFVDLGKGSGIEVGNRLYVIRRGDAYPKRREIAAPKEKDDRRYPKEAVAEIIIVDVRDKTAAGLISRSIMEVGIGDRVEARAGY